MELGNWIDSYMEKVNSLDKCEDVIEAEIGCCKKTIHIFKGIDELANKYGKLVSIEERPDGWNRHSFVIGGFEIFEYRKISAEREGV